LLSLFACSLAELYSVMVREYCDIACWFSSYLAFNSFFSLFACYRFAYSSVFAFWSTAISFWWLSVNNFSYYFYWV